MSKFIMGCGKSENRDVALFFADRIILKTVNEKKGNVPFSHTYSETWVLHLRRVGDFEARTINVFY